MNAYIGSVTTLTCDVLVVGGGVVGLSTALAASGKGLTVTILDSQVGGGATYAAAGMLSPGAELLSGEVHAAREAQESLELWPSFSDVAAIARPTQSGSLLVGWSGGDRREIDRLTSASMDFGIERQLLVRGAAEIIDRYSPRISEGFYFPSDSFVDVDEVRQGLVATLRNRGVSFVATDAVTLLDDKVVRVETHQGCFEAPFAVLATGANGALARQLNVESAAVRPVRGVTVRLQRRQRGQTGMIRALVDGRPIYVIERSDGSVVVGASSDESNDRYVDALAVSELLRLALLIYPSLDGAEFVEARSGLRPVAQAGLPFFQEISPNCVWTSGYYRHGVLMAPLAYRHVERRLG